MPIFYLIRHGQRISRDEDTLLSEVGVKQAELTGKYLHNLQPKHVYTSPLKRTLQTAEIINQALNLPLTTDDRLRERMEYTPEMGPFSAFLQEWDKTMADRSFQPQYGNSAQMAGERILSLFQELEDDNAYVFISHGGVIGDVVRNLFDETQLPQLAIDVQKQLSWLSIAECSVTEIHKSNCGYSLRRVNDVSHLQI